MSSSSLEALVIQVRYVWECTVPIEREEKKKKPLFESEAKPPPPKQSVKFKCRMQSEITKKFAKKCQDASSRP